MSNPTERTQSTTGGLSELTENERLVREYALLEAEIEPLQARMNEIKKYLRGSLDYGTHDIAGLKVSIAHNSRLDPKKVLDLYPPAANPELYKQAPDSAAMKRILPGAVIEAMKTEGEPRVTIS